MFFQRCSPDLTLQSWLVLARWEAEDFKPYYCKGRLSSAHFKANPTRRDRVCGSRKIKAPAAEFRLSLFSQNRHPLNPQTETLDPQPQTLNPTPQTLNAKPSIRNYRVLGVWVMQLRDS